jgi:hypothetical protein
MAIKALKDALERVETWPEEAQQELAEIAREIDAELGSRVYHATTEELDSLDEAERGGVADEKEVEAAFRSFHPE